ncbi:MAG: dUTP diphosphatase [Clostridia bacterium]|nr:dUTP diphosphatase [Clostridia bacterium]
MSKLEISVKRLKDNVKMPFYATEGSAGLDLSAALDKPLTLKKGEIALIPTGIAISIPTPDYGAFIYARSGLASKHGICLANSVGVVDSDYRGEIKCALINLGSMDFVIEPGERIAQMVFMPVAQAKLNEVETLDKTERGAGGFGSTGR